MGEASSSPGGAFAPSATLGRHTLRTSGDWFVRAASTLSLTWRGDSCTPRWLKPSDTSAPSTVGYRTDPLPLANIRLQNLQVGRIPPTRRRRGSGLPRVARARLHCFPAGLRVQLRRSLPSPQCQRECPRPARCYLHIVAVDTLPVCGHFSSPRSSTLCRSDRVAGRRSAARSVTSMPPWAAASSNRVPEQSLKPPPFVS